VNGPDVGRAISGLQGRDRRLVCIMVEFHGRVFQKCVAGLFADANQFLLGSSALANAC